MRSERLLQVIGLGITAGVVYESSKYAFTRSARKEIGARDEWTCQGRNGSGCVHESGFHGKAASFQDGFWVQAAHYPEDHHHSGYGYHDKDTSNGRILCTLDHAIEEINRGNESGAQKLCEMGVFSWDHEKETGQQWNPTIEEVLEIEARTAPRESVVLYQADPAPAPVK